jgi:hypothetical protein
MEADSGKLVPRPPEARESDREQVLNAAIYQRVARRHARQPGYVKLIKAVRSTKRRGERPVNGRSGSNAFDVSDEQRVRFLFRWDPALTQIP